MCSEPDEDQSDSFAEDFSKKEKNKKRNFRTTVFEKLDQSLNESFIGELERTLKLEKIEEGEGIIGKENELESDQDNEQSESQTSNY